MKYFYTGLAIVLFGGLLNACGVSYPPKPFSDEILPTETIAQIDEIRSRPVLVRFLNGTAERTAQLGTSLRVGESLRTEADARVQIVLISGGVVRIGGDSALTLNPKSQIRLDTGKVMVAARLENGNPLAEPVVLQTPFGLVSTGDGVFYGEVPKEPNQKRSILVLEGTVKIKLSNGGREISLKKGDEIPIKADGVPETTKRPNQAELESRFAKSDLLFGFSTRFAGQSLWEGQLKIARREPEQVKFRREDQNRNRPTPAPVTAPVTAPSPAPTTVRRDPVPEPVTPPTPHPPPSPPPTSEPIAPTPPPPVEPIAPEPPPPP